MFEENQEEANDDEERSSSNYLLKRHELQYYSLKQHAVVIKGRLPDVVLKTFWLHIFSPGWIPQFW
jgi:hypothetical protein